ncbi:unnamed protein product, partial [Pylaiella littoralis]
AAGGGGGGGGGGGEGLGAGCAGSMPLPTRGAFLEANLPWGKRRRISGNLRWKMGQRTRKVFCAAEGRELVVYDLEDDSNAGLPPRARYLVMGVRSVKTGPNAMELDVTVADESELVTLGWPSNAGAAPGLPFIETRSVTLTAAGRHEHARWELALEEAQSWTECKEREALMEELELSLPFRETAFDHVQRCLPDATIENMLGVSAAKNNPGCVLKSMVFDAAEAAASAGPLSSPELTGSAGPGLGFSRHASYSGGGGGGGGGSSSAWKLSGAPSSSFRGLLSIFDSSARSPQGDEASGGGGGYVS